MYNTLETLCSEWKPRMCDPLLPLVCAQDKAGRPLIYYRAALQDFSKPEQAVKYLVRRHIQCFN